MTDATPDLAERLVQAVSRVSMCPPPTDTTTELDGVIPAMPSQCITCKGWFELNDMWGSIYNFSAVVCDDCHRDELAPASEDEED